MALLYRNRIGRLAIGLAWSCAIACSSDATGARHNSIRFLVVQGAEGIGQRLIEYEALPFRQRRSMPTFTGDSGMSVLLHANANGFFAVRFAGTSLPEHGWELVRYGADWHVAASRSAAVLVDTVAVVWPLALQITPDRRYVVLAVNAPSNLSNTLVVLDAVTLAVVNRTGRPLPQFPNSAPTAATGSEVLLASGASGACPTPLVWLDVATGLTADSTTMPCDYVLNGMLSSRQIYRRGPQSTPSPHFELYNITTATVTATVDSASPAFQPSALATHGRLVYFEPGNALVLDAQALTVIGRVPTGEDASGPRTVTHGVIDSATGLVIAVSAPRTFCIACFPSPDGIVILDPDSLTVLVDHLIGAPVSVVH